MRLPGLAVLLALLAVVPASVALDPDLRADPEWHLTDAGAGATAASLTQAIPGTTSTITIGVHDAPVRSFTLDALTHARLDVAVDGTIVDQFWGGGGKQTFDVALDPETAHTITLKAAPSDTDAVAGLSSWGARTLVAPTITTLATDLVGCVAPPIHIDLSAAVGIASVTATLDGAPAEAHAISTSRSMSSVTTAFTIATPNWPEGDSDHVLHLTARDATGNVWDLGSALIHAHLHRDVSATPEGWVYAEEPQLSLVPGHCAADIRSVRLTLDGLDATPALQGGTTYVFPNALAYEEAHTFAFDIELRDGSTVHLAREIREGLDHMDLDLSPGVVLFHTNDLGGAITLPILKGAPVASANVAGLPLLARVEPLPLGSHARALYAPRAIHCELGTCSPFGGDAPGFGPADATAATLRFPSFDGYVVTLEAAGQFAAAAAMST